MNTLPYRRIAVIGTTGTGKSTLASIIAHRLNIPHHELDALHWQPGWVESPHEKTRQKVAAFTCQDAWVTDGNYTFCRDLIWPRLEAVIWLDYSLGVILWRLWWRTWRRVISGELLWGTNSEKFWPQFFSRDSIFYWAIKTYSKRKLTYQSLFTLNAYTHLVVFHFRSPRQTTSWLRSWS